MVSIRDRVFKQLQSLPSFSRYWLAYSGGVDSHVLLHIAAEWGSLQGVEVVAVHVNHGLMPEASQWASHCAHTAKQRGLACAVLAVDARPVSGESPEAKARHLRYQAIDALMHEQDCLLTAHHQDDQAETLLLQLLRGSGPRGLASMALCSSNAGRTVMRPMLDISREHIQAYADHEKLQWIDDASNTDQGFDRNYLRHEVIPLLKQRWPSMAKTLSRSARLCAEASEDLEQQAQLDFAQVKNIQGLSVTALQQLSEHRLNNVLRYWIRNNNFAVPSQAVLRQIHGLLQAGADARPLLCWNDTEIRRFKDTIQIMTALAPFDPKARPWHWDQELHIEGLGRLRSEKRQGAGIRCSSEGVVSVRFRRGGERFRQGEHHHSLKKLFQERNIPPWQRDRTPLIYLDEELVAVGDWFVCDHFAATKDQSAWCLQWEWE